MRVVGQLGADAKQMLVLFSKIDKLTDPHALPALKLPSDGCFHPFSFSLPNFPVLLPLVFISACQPFSFSVFPRQRAVELAWPSRR